MKKLISRWSIFLIIFILMFTQNVLAAEVTIGASGTGNFTNAKFYVLGSSNVTTYTTYSGTTVAGAIYPGDLCTVLDASGTYWKVSYPTSKGSKIAYCNKENILSNTSYSQKISISSNETVYTKSDMSTKFGTVFTTDTIYMLSPVSDGKAQIIYNVPGGYKIGWIYATTDSAQTSKKTMSSVLYGNSSISSRLTCKFDGYTTTKGRHEGIDFSYGYGKPIYSLINGEVIRVETGSAKALSTIAIYDKDANKTVIYLHSAPSVKKGDIVKVGSKLGTEDNRAGGSTHTHVEVRAGKQYYAAVSVGDQVLDNADPTSYWVSKGYLVK